MRIRSLLTAIALFTTTVFAVEIVSSVPEDEESFDHPAVDPVLAVTASFPEDNPFGHVVNGELNKLLLTIENRTGKNVTLLSVAGEFLHPNSEQLIKTANNLTYGVALPDTSRIQLPYQFHSEFRTGDIKLNVWLEHIIDGERKNVSAFESIVMVVEPELSIFDFKLLTTYVMVLAILGGLSYVAYLSFVPQTKQKKTAPISKPETTVTPTGTGGYQEEWIPEHHLRKAKARKGRGAVSSADEQSGVSGAEVSGTEGKRRSNRFKK